jgi:hypothetical protein
MNFIWLAIVFVVVSASSLSAGVASANDLIRWTRRGSQAEQLSKDGELSYSLNYVDYTRRGKLVFRVVDQTERWDANPAAAIAPRPYTRTHHLIEFLLNDEVFLWVALDAPAGLVWDLKTTDPVRFSYGKAAPEFGGFDQGEYRFVHVSIPDKDYSEELEISGVNVLPAGQEPFASRKQGEHRIFAPGTNYFATPELPRREWIAIPAIGLTRPAWVR